MCTKQEIASVVRQEITDLAGYVHAEITDGKDLELDLCLDYLDKTEVILNLEERFGINVTESEENRMRTVGDVIRGVEAKLSEKGQVEL